MKVGFIGLGTMGSGMALNTLKGGHELVVHDINRDAAAPHLEAGARIYLEGTALPEIPRRYNVLRSGRAGQARCLLVQWRPDEQPP